MAELQQPELGSSTWTWIIYLMSKTSIRVVIIALILAGLLLPTGIYVHSKWQAVANAGKVFNGYRVEEITIITKTLKTLPSDIKVLAEIKKNQDDQIKEFNRLKLQIARMNGNMAILVDIMQGFRKRNRGDSSRNFERKEK